MGGSGGLNGLYNPDKKDFSPRVSVVWDPTGKGKTVLRAGYGLFFDAFSQDMMLGHLPYPTFYAPGPAYNNIGPDPVQMANANPAAFDGNGVYIPNTPIYGAPNCNVECDIFSFDRNIKTPYMENYNLNIQHQFSSKVSLQFGYVGSQGHRLFRFFDLNQPSQQTITNCDLSEWVWAAYPMSSTTSRCRVTSASPTVRPIFSRKIPLEAPTIIRCRPSSASANYHGFTSLVNYVWSKSLDNSSDGEDFVVNAAQPQDSNNPKAEYGPSNFNIPHRFVWIASYAFPQDERQHGEAEEWLGHRERRHPAKRPALQSELQL